jgi:hypothetical protein
MGRVVQSANGFGATQLITLASVTGETVETLGPAGLEAIHARG